MLVIGRTLETEALQKAMQTAKSEFVMIYGRRRVGKTFLIRELLGSQFAFYSTGLAQANLQTQLATFTNNLKSNPYYIPTLTDPQNWMEAFDSLSKVLAKNPAKQKIIFLDELPWLDTKNSGFITALEYFWNAWASGRKDIKLIVCGSAASWMIQNLIENKGGLHNRVTKRIKLHPFTLRETKEFLLSKKAHFDDYQIVQLYMALGGIPYYLDFIESELSATQNIDTLLFGEYAPLKGEYHLLFSSLFKNYQSYIDIVETLATKKRGLRKEEIVKLSGFSDGGTMTKILNELEASDFIRKYQMPGKQVRNAIYQLTDNFTLFYANFLKTKSSGSKNYWLNIINTGTYNNWAGNAFEMVCLQHIEQIKKALGISGILSQEYAWQNSQTQVDIVIDRSDNIINLIEIKFVKNVFIISKEYAQKLRNKIQNLSEYFKTKKTVWLVLLTTFGLKNKTNAGDIVKELDMKIFF